MDDIVITLESPRTLEAQALIARMSSDLGERYGDDGSGSFKPEDTEVAGGAFVIARINDQPAGCGAIRPLKEGIGEVKRMYVDPPFRGRGIGLKILAELESIAAAFGYERLWLETGVRQPESIALYEKAGYIRIECYGKYASDPLSVCFEKRLR